MSGLLSAVRGAVGLGADGQKDNTDAGVSANGLDKSKALAFTQERWEDLKNAYIVYHQSIWQALLFYANQSWIDWDDARKVWQPQQPTDEWVPRPRINRFSPTIDAVTSNIYQIPEIEAVPSNDDDLDPGAAMVAKLCTRLAEYVVDHEGLKKQYDMQGDRAGLAANLYVLCGGLASIIQVTSSTQQVPQQAMQNTKGYQCDTCDTYTQLPIGQDPPQFCPGCGQPVDVQDSELMAPMMDPATNQPVMQDTGEYTLNLRIESNLGAFPRPGATSLDDSPYLLWALRRPLDSIWYLWQFEAQPDAIWPDGYAVTYEHALNFWYTGYSNSTIQVKDSCMTLEMYVPPKKVKDHPEGFFAVVINDVLAHSEQWRFPDHPVTFGYYLVLPTIFFPRSIGFDLVEIQRELNAYESVIKLHAMVAAVDPVVIDANTIVTEITGRSDKIIKWRPIGPNSEPPHRMGAGHLDDGIYKQRDNLHAEFQNISMAVNAFRGEQEGAITAAAAIQQLRSQAELMFSKPVANWANFWCETVRKYVRFIQYYFSVAQIAEIVGPGHDQEIMMFKTAKLDDMTRWVASQHGLPKTRDEKRQEFMTMWDKGALDLSDPSVRQKVYELFGETGMQRTFNQDATNARIENQEFKAWQSAGPGTPPPNIQPQPLIEDMAVHLYFHKDQAKSQDFKKWPPQNQQALIEHIMQTVMEMQKAAALAMAQANAASPGPKKDNDSSGAPAGQKSTAQVNGNKGATASQGG
jgi:hypothetical protein